MNRKKNIGILILTISLLLAGCGTKETTTNVIKETTSVQEESTIELSDSGILVDGKAISEDTTSAVYGGADIVYYEDGKDDTYGEGTDEDAHTQEEAEKHEVITITQSGVYRVNGTLSAGQIAIDLGEDAKEDEEAKVTLIMDNAEITCSVAPAIVVYNAYECGSDDTKTATANVDTSNAGFNLILADDSTNTVNGAYVAKIYEEGTTDKLYKFDAAIDSKVSFNIDGETDKNGKLIVNAENEGISSDLHMTMNGGDISISSGDDSINTNEDSVSVFTVNDGILNCNSGMGSEGDGIDSNGYIVINGGYVSASANEMSQDSGVDSDLGIIINGGTVLGTGNMYDEISKESEQSYIVLSFQQTQSADKKIVMYDETEKEVVAFNPESDFTVLVYSSPEIVEGDYSFLTASDVEGDIICNVYTNISNATKDEELQYSSSSVGGMGGARPDNAKMQEKFKDDMDLNRDDMEEPDSNMEPSVVFTITTGGNQFGGITSFSNNES